MKIPLLRVHWSLAPLLLSLMLGSAEGLFAGNDVLGEIRLTAASKEAKTAGVWVDGQYVGYLKELKGSKKILLMPGEHLITVRQAGYTDFSTNVIVEPGQKHAVTVAMQRNPEARIPEVTAEVKISVSPNRAAVFVDDRYVGHVDEFDGPGQALLLAPGKHRVKITLPGYQPFETEINLLANQKFELKTELFKGSIMNAGTLIREEKSSVAQVK